MGEVIGTCGHLLENVAGNCFYVKDYSGKYGKALTYICVCDRCAEWYRQIGHSFKNKEEAMKWLETARGGWNIS